MSMLAGTAVNNGADEEQQGGAQKEPGSAIRAALTASTGMSAQGVAHAHALAQRLDLPEGIVQTDPATAQREHTALTLEQNLLLAEWATESGARAAIARDDAPGLVSVFDKISNLGADLMHGVAFDTPEAVQKTGYALTHGAADFNRSLAGAALMATENTFGERSLPAQWSRSALEWVERNRPPEVTADSALAQFGYDFVRSVPQQAGNIMAALASPATALGMMAAQIAGGDYTDLRAKGVSPGRAAASSLLDATVQAPMERLALGRMLNIFKSTGFVDTVKKTLGAAGTEFITEYLQKAPELVSRLWGEAEKRGDTAAEQIAWFSRTLFNADTLLQAHNEGVYEGLIGAVWGGLGGVGRVALNSQARKMQAQTFAQNQSELHALVENTNTKQLSPPYMQDALQAAGLNQNVSMPAAAVLELYQKGTDILAPLGWDIADVQSSAALGQDIEAPLSRLHAYLDQAQFDAVAPIMRATVETPNINELAEEDARVTEAAQLTLEEMEQYQVDQNDLDAETERLRGELITALQSIPGLESQIRADATLEESAREQGMTPEKAANYVLDLHTSFARRLSEYGIKPADYLRKVSVSGLVRDGRQRLVSENEVALEGLSQNQLRAARRQSPVGDAVWGQLDRTAIRNAYGQDTVKAIEDRYGKGVFAKKRGRKAAVKGSLNNDSLANELVRRGFLPEGSSLDDMVNYLATGEDVDTGRALWQEGTAFPNNGRAVGRISEDIAKSLKLGKPGDIVLDDAGIQHIEGRHGKELRSLGFRDGRGFVDFVLANPDAVYGVEGNGRKYDIVSRSMKPQGRVMVRLEFAEGGDFYQIVTAGTVRRKYYDKKTPLWESANLNRSEEPLTHISGQSGVKGNIGQTGINGKTLFQTDDPANVRGKVDIKDDGYLISLFKKADLSTLLHETGHVFLNEMQRVIDMGLGDERLRADFDAIHSWLGAKPGEVFTTEQHEKFARGFEAWLREGKAPVRNLESAFARFKKWLTRIYRKASSLNVELTDDVRDVFTRMLATDQEIEIAARENGLLDLTTKELDALGVQGADRVYASGLMRAAKDAAAARMQEARDRGRREQLASWAKTAREEIDSDPVYIALRGMHTTPLDLEAVRESLGEDMAAALMRRVPGGLKRGGMAPEIFAAEHGFENGAGFMISQMLDAPNLAQRIRELVAEHQRMHDLLYDPADYLLETDEAADQVALVGKYIAQAAGNHAVEQASVARVVEERLAAMPMSKAVRAGNFRLAMRRALEKERRAVAQGDFAAALEANTQARLNMEFARRAADIKHGQEKLAARIRHFTRMDKADPQARFFIMDMAMRHGLGKFNARLAEGKSAETIQDWMKRTEDAGYTLFLDEEAVRGNLPWREMNVTSFENLTETINQIITVERNQRKLLSAQGKADLDAVAVDISLGISKYRDIKTLKAIERDPALKKLASGIHAVHTKVEALCLALDGDKPGLVWEYIYKPITEAEDAQNDRFKAVRDALRGSSLFGTYSRRELADMGRKKVFVPEIGERLTHENRIAVALNMGNAVNIERIKDGFGWTDEQIAAVLRPLAKKDWDFVQSVWDYLETFREESFALQEEISGMRPTAVEAQPVQTPFGTYRGGYYPIKYNVEKSSRAFQQEQAAMDKEFFGGRNYGAAQTRQGHLKERARGGQKNPLLLELSVVTDHVFNVVHDLSYRKAVLDVSKVIRHGTVRQAIEGAVGREMYRELMPWLQDMANERQEPMHYVHRWANWARSATSIMQMGFKFTTMLTQPLGYTQTIEMLGYRWAGYGLRRVYGNPLRLPALLEETFARSPMMANRIKSFDREVRDITKQLRPSLGRFGWLDKVKEKAFTPMGIFQLGVDLPTWWGAYEKGLKDFTGDERKAAQYADSIVRLSQGGGATKDLARVQRGGELLRLTTMFYSYFNTFYNLAARRFSALRQDHSPAAIFKAANTALLLWFMPAVLSELVAGRGPDDDEEPLEWAAINLLQYPFQAVVGVRDVTNAAFGEYDYQITPAQTAPTSLVKWFKSVNKALEEEDAGLLVKPTAEVAGYLLGLPLKQPIITVGNVWDYLTGEDPEFEVRDLFFVKPKSRR